MAKKKYDFILSNLSIKNIRDKYIDEIPSIITENKLITPINEIINPKSTNIISFLDEAKRRHTCNICMIDINSQNEASLLKYNCFWCKNSFSTVPIGCPINYVSDQAVKKYYSHISRDTYTIKENVITQQPIDNSQITIYNNDYFESDGVFCSFNCCKAFINDNKHDSIYDKSDLLLTKIFNKIMSTKNLKISPAPHWRTLKSYGGFLTIEKFRDSFNKIDYVNHGIDKQIKFNPIGYLYEEKIKF